MSPSLEPPPSAAAEERYAAAGADAIGARRRGGDSARRREWVKLRARRGAREVSSAGVAELRRAAERPSNEVSRRKLAHDVSAGKRGQVALWKATPRRDAREAADVRAILRATRRAVSADTRPELPLSLLQARG